MGSISDKIKSWTSDGNTQSPPVVGGGVSDAIGEFVSDLTDPFYVKLSKFKIYAIVVCSIIALIISWVLDRPTSSYVSTTFNGLIIAFLFFASINRNQKLQR